MKIESTPVTPRETELFNRLVQLSIEFADVSPDVFNATLAYFIGTDLAASKPSEVPFEFLEALVLENFKLGFERQINAPR